MIPPLTEFGVLPVGTCDTTFAEVERRFVVNEYRRLLWTDFQRYLGWIQGLSFFSTMYMGGSFVTNDATPDDIDVTLAWDASRKPGAKAQEIAHAMKPDFTKPEFRVQAWPERAPFSFVIFTKMTLAEADRRGAPRNTMKGALRIPL